MPNPSGSKASLIPRIGLIAGGMIACMLLGGVWAFAVLERQVFPYAQLKEVRDIVQGVPGDDRPLWTRLLSSVAFVGRAFPAESGRAELAPAAAFTPVVPTPDMPAPRPAFEAMRIANLTGETRYFVVFGSFFFSEEQENLGVIALDSTGKLHRAWPVRVEGGEYRGPHIGVSISDNGVIATNAKGILTGQNWCGEKLWQAPWTPHPDGNARDFNAPDGYDWHHDIDYDDGAFYTFLGLKIMRVNADTGAIEGETDLIDVMRWAWRQGLSLLDAAPGGSFPNPKRFTSPDAIARELPEDPLHPNKVDVLSRELAPLYPMFEAGDFLVSVRNLNLLLVVRPREERILWWRYGLTSRQHDATFVDGAIEVFNNAPFTVPPRPTIRRIDVDGQGFEDVIDLSQWQMTMRKKGNFQHDGDRILTVDEAGRMIAGRTDGAIDVVFENDYLDAEGKTGNLQLRNAIELSAETFARFQAQCAG